MTPAAARSDPTEKASNAVGSRLGSMCTRMPCRCQHPAGQRSELLASMPRVAANDDAGLGCPWLVVS